MWASRRKYERELREVHFWFGSGWSGWIERGVGKM